MQCTASLLCLLSYSNMQDMKLMWLIQYLLLLFICDRKSKSHMSKLNHPSCWCNAYLVIDLYKRGLSINTQLWEKWWFYFLRPENCHQPSGATLLLYNKPIAELVTWLHIPFVCVWIYLLAQFYYYLISTLQNWSFDSIPICLLLDDSFPQSLFQHPTLSNVSMDTQVNRSRGAANSVWWGHRKAKLWLMKKSGSSGIKKYQLMAGSETYLWGTDRFVLSGFFSCLLRKRTEKETKTEPQLS